METKECNKCHKIKPLSEFHIRTRGTHNRKPTYLYKCKQCKKEYDHKRWLPAGREMITDQHCCQICGRADKLVVDHNHSTGYIRGLLCSWCNYKLGFYEKLKFRKEMQTYLDTYGNNTKYGKYNNPKRK